MKKETSTRVLRMLLEKAATLREKVAEADRGDAVRLLEEYIRQEREAGEAARIELLSVEADIAELQQEGEKIQ